MVEPGYAPVPIVRAQAPLQYGGPLGYEELRDAICTYLRTARAVHCNPGQVMIVAGSQEALEISARVLLDVGTPVWLEETWILADSTCSRLGGLSGDTRPG